MPTLERSVAEIPLPNEPELLQEARAICRDRLADNLDQPELLSLHGRISAREGRLDVALRCLRRAVTLAPDNAGYLMDLALALQRCGRHGEAVSACLRALRLSPDDVEIWRELAKGLTASSQLLAAGAVYQEYLYRQPDDLEALGALGDVLRDRGQRTEAIAIYERCIREASTVGTCGNADANVVANADAIAAEAYRRIGDVRVSRREWAVALEAFRRGLELADDRVAELHVGAGRALMSLGEFAQAVTAFRDALNIDTTHADASSQLVVALELLGRKGDAVRAWLHLGKALEIRDKFEEAAIAYRQAIARKADCLEALLRLGDVMLMLRQPAEAIRYLRAALVIDPKHGIAHFKLGWALQLIGETEEGWDEFAWLCHPHRIKAWRALEQPMWDGSDPAGKTIFLWAGLDYGLGDSLNLIRFARHLKRRGARIVTESQASIAPLLARMPEIDRAVPRGDPLPAFDVHAPFMWVPIVDRAARALVRDDVPYLTVDRSRVDEWRRQLGSTNGKTVGLSWGGDPHRSNARFRSAPLSTFAPLGRVEGIRLVSLQLGLQADELVCPPPGLHIDVLLDESSALADTAALIDSLDLVITVDTMIGHLAGALGKRVWVALPYACDWKWGTGEETNWYPTMRLFHPSTHGGWSEIGERMATELAAWMSADSDQAYGLT